MGLKVYTGGTFDLPHGGHVNFLKKCAQLGDVYVALNTDKFIEQYKGKPPVMSFDERAEVISHFRSVRGVISNDSGADSRQTILEIQPDIIAIGSDWARKDYYKQMGFDQDWLDSNNISLIYIPYTQRISSTELKRRMFDM